jgi:hypothetical protein
MLGKHVYGAKTINRSGDAPEVMEVWCRFETRNPGLFQRNGCLELADQVGRQIVFAETLEMV